MADLNIFLYNKRTVDLAPITYCKCIMKISYKGHYEQEKLL